MAQWFWALFLVLTCESARVVNTNGLLPVIPPGHEDPNAEKAAPDPIEQADGKVVQSVSWDVAEDFNLARARARERREQRMAAQQAMAAKAQAEAEAKVKAAWEKNARKNGSPQAKVTPAPSTTVVHLVRKPRAHDKKQTNHTGNRTNRTVAARNVSNMSQAQDPDPALDGLDHIAQKVAHFGEALEKFTKAQAAKGKKAQKLPPKVEKIMENAEDLMKKIIAVADDKAMDMPELDAKKDNASAASELKSASHVKVETNAISNPANSTPSLPASASGKNASSNFSKLSYFFGNTMTAPMAQEANGPTNRNATNTKNKTFVMASNATNVMPVNAANATVFAVSKNVTQVSNMSHNETLKISRNTTIAATTSKNSSSIAGSKPATNRSTLGNQTVKAAETPKKNNATENTSATKNGPRVTPTHFNKPDRMVHSALGAARLAAAKLRGMRVKPHKPVKIDDSWKAANSEIDSRIVGLKAAKDEALRADDHDLADSLQEKIKGLQTEAVENEAKAKKVKGKHHR